MKYWFDWAHAAVTVPPVQEAFIRYLLLAVPSRNLLPLSVPLNVIHSLASLSMHSFTVCSWHYPFPFWAFLFYGFWYPWTGVCPRHYRFWRHSNCYSASPLSTISWYCALSPVGAATDHRHDQHDCAIWSSGRDVVFSPVFRSAGPVSIVSVQSQTIPHCKRELGLPLIPSLKARAPYTP